MPQALLERSLEDVDRDVYGLIVAVDAHRSLFWKMERRLTGVENRLDQTMNMVGDLANDMNRRFEAVDRRFEGIDARLDGLDRRLGRIEELLIELLGRSNPVEPAGS
jgi:hypothetical protein